LSSPEAFFEKVTQKRREVDENKDTSKIENEVNVQKGKVFTDLYQPLMNGGFTGMGSWTHPQTSAPCQVKQTLPGRELPFIAAAIWKNTTQFSVLSASFFLFPFSNCDQIPTGERSGSSAAFVCVSALVFSLSIGVRERTRFPPRGAITA